MIPGDLRFVNSRPTKCEAITCLPRDMEGRWSDDHAFTLLHGTPIIYVRFIDNSHMFYAPDGHFFFLLSDLVSGSVQR